MTKKNPVLILGAMDGEIKGFLGAFENLEKHIWNDYVYYTATYQNRKIIISKTGVGKILASMVTQKMIDLFSPSLILCTGIAGSLNTKFGIGDVLIGNDAIQHDFDAGHFKFKRGEIPYTEYRFLKGDPTLINTALTIDSKRFKVETGRVLTGDQFIVRDDSEQYSYLTEELEGDCVEMEGAAVALVSTVNQIPHLIIRTISDKADSGKKVNIRGFLKQASENSLEIVIHLLNNI